jgi:hypothetical protein
MIFLLIVWKLNPTPFGLFLALFANSPLKMKPHTCNARLIFNRSLLSSAAEL